MNEDIEICSQTEGDMDEITIEYASGHKQIVIWSEMLSYFYKYVFEKVRSNYDRYYLENVIKDIDNAKFNTLIAGSSYARFGFDDELLNETVANVALPSQDIYYACSLIKRLAQKKNRIKKVILGIGYTTTFSDLSRTKNEKEIKRVTNVYYPILNDIHNALMITEREDRIVSCIWNIPYITSIISREIYNNNMHEKYFNDIKQRSKSKTCLWDQKNMEWWELCETDRMLSARTRAEMHNRNLTHIETFEENKRLIINLIEWCKTQEIQFLLMTLPTTSEYKKYLSHEFKKEFYEFLNSVDYTIDLIDLVDETDFRVEDFNDMDHLNQKGAEKVTKRFNEFLEDWGKI